LILLDTSGLLAAIDSSQNQHAQAAAAVREAGGPLLLSPFVLAELDYLLAVRVSPRAQRALLDEVARGAYQLEPFTANDVASATVVMRRYPQLAIGLADASIVVLAERYGVLDVLTLDRRHFNAMRGPEGRRFRLMPAPIESDELD
jgi:predicted nucleic acid-binding protein